MDWDDLTALVRTSEVGRAAPYATPFGTRRLFYADLTATGRSLSFVERWVERARALYANTHTAVSTTGALMTRLREDARKVIAEEVRAGPEHRVVFTGSGATSAVHKLVGLLGLRIPEPLERRFALSLHIPPSARPVVFVGPYEHHSNELPWRESLADVVVIDLAADGTIDLADLEDKLARHADRPLKIGAFSAASNVTGVLTDVATIARILRRHGAFSVFDYAAAGPYVPIDVTDLDAIFLSVHKFIGGPESSGVLVAKTSLFSSRTPERPGGGTVEYVSGSGAPDYTGSLVEREEGGTPAILGDIRAGLAFLVKRLAGPAAILEHEVTTARRFVDRLAQHPAIHVLGPHQCERLGIISFTIERLHHDLVGALLDHLFGIQNRAGCACAGPYGHRLLGITEAGSERFRALIHRGVLGMKPGWVRLSLPWYATDEELDFLASAVELIADVGHRFIPLYRLGWSDGVWHPVAGAHFGRAHDDPFAATGTPPPELTLEDLLRAPPTPDPTPSDAALVEERRLRLAQARALAERLEAGFAHARPAMNPPTGDAEIDALVWFDYLHTTP